jgi:hypothetical protein
MSSLLTASRDFEEKSKAQQQLTEERLKAAFSKHENVVKSELNASAKRINDAISAHEQGMNAAMQSNRLSVLRMVGRTWLTITMVSGLLFASLSGVLWYQEPDSGEPGGNQAAERYAVETAHADVGRDLSGEPQRTVSGAAGGDESRNGPDGGQQDAERGEAGTGVEQNDGTGKTIAERVRAATAGLLEKAGRVGERLRGMAEDVWSYATGERGAERARVGLEQAGAEFERAAAPVIDRLNEIEQQRYGQTTEKEPEKTADLVPERQRTLSHGDREYGD